MAGLAAATPVVVTEVRAWAAQNDTLNRLVQEWAKVSAKQGRLLPVQVVQLDQLGVHAARVQIPYIERDQQHKLEEAVGPGQAALIVGNSMSGKTRLAAEVIRQKCPNALLLPPESGKALRELIKGGLDTAGMVIWLDTLELFLGPEGLTIGLLNQLIGSKAIVVATIRVKEREKYRIRDELQKSEWEVLRKFREISLQRRLTDSELDRVNATVSDPGVRDAVKHYGLAEYLSAGPEALDKFEKGESANPVGHALVQAAVDWRRVGLIRPISKEFLITVLSTYLADRSDVPRTSQAIEDGLVWATEKINETVALLSQNFTSANGPLFEAFDYLVDHLSRSSTPVPDQMWTFAMQQAEPVELIRIGLTAFDLGRLATTETAWRQAAEKGSPEVAPLALVNLGVLREEQDDLEGAKAAYRQAIDSGHADARPRALLNLGLLLTEQGDVEGAEKAYRQASESGHADAAPRAANSLGALLREQGKVEEAIAAFRQASESGHPGAVPKAANNLGLLLEMLGEPFCIVFRVVHRHIRDRAIQVVKLRSPDVLPIIARYLATVTYKAGILGDGNGKARDTVARERYPPYWLIGFGVLVRVTPH